MVAAMLDGGAKLLRLSSPITRKELDELDLTKSLATWPRTKDCCAAESGGSPGPAPPRFSAGCGGCLFFAGELLLVPANVAAAMAPFVPLYVFAMVLGLAGACTKAREAPLKAADWSSFSG